MHIPIFNQMCNPCKIFLFFVFFLTLDHGVENCGFSMLFRVSTFFFLLPTIILVRAIYYYCTMWAGLKKWGKTGRVLGCKGGLIK